MDAAEFVRRVFVELPELRGPLVDWLNWDVDPDSGEEIERAIYRSIEQDGSTFALYQAMAVLMEHTQNAIDEGDREQVRRYFTFVDRALAVGWERASAAGDTDVVNAIAVSYFEVLNFLDQKKQRSWAAAELPPRSADLARETQGDLFPD